MSAIRTKIDFENKNLTIEMGHTIIAGEKFLFEISDPTDTIIHQNAGYTASDFSSPDLDVSATILTISIGSATEDIIQGTYVIGYKSTADSYGGAVSVAVATIIYCMEIPTVSLLLSYSCLDAEIVSTDSTDYDITCSCTGEDIVPSVAYAHTMIYPTTMEVPIANLTGTSATLTAPDLWTKYWVSKLVSTLIYTMPSATRTGSTSYYVYGSITGIDDVTVVCSDCACEMLSCLTAIATRYQDALEEGSQDLFRYTHLELQILALEFLYRKNQQCGTEADVRAICGQIKDLMGSECTCCDEDDESIYSTEVTAVTSGGTTVITGITWYSGDDVPDDATLGINGDFYLRTNGQIYKKILGSWVAQFTMSITSLLSNYIMYEVYTAASTTSGSLASLGTTTFDKADVKDGSAIVCEANFTFEEDTSADTQVQLVFAGVTSETDNFYIDTTNDGTSYTATIRMTYYIEDTAGTFYVVAKKHEAVVNGSVVDVVFKKGLTIALDTTGNAFTIKAKTDESKYISLDTLKVIQEQTTA